MKISGIKTPARINFAAKNTAEKNPKKHSSYNFCGNDASKVDAAILGASALIGLLIYFGLAPQGKKAATKDLKLPQVHSGKTSFSQNSKKNWV